MASNPYYQPDDYIHSKEELDYLKSEMQRETDLLREERTMNQELVPFDENGHNIEIVKE